MIGTILRQRYRIIQQLGGGGFGETYLAEDLDIPVNPKPKCVVKRLQPQMTHPGIVRLFEKEGEFLYRLGQNHDQIPKLFAYFQENQEFYLIQEYIDGHDLTQEIILGKQWSEAEVIKFLREILEVLAFVHQNNVIHRDIKPANIMRRRRDGKLMLIDFGIVKEISSVVVNSSGQTSFTVAVGTPGYMPSEQAQGRPKFSSDIYAVGMIAIQALTGIPLNSLPEDSNGELIWRNHASVSNGLANILTKMVRYDFRQRYQNAAEVLQALTSSASVDPTIAISPGLTPQNRSVSQPRTPWKTLIGLGVVAFGAIAIPAILINSFLQRTPPEPITTQPESSIASYPTPTKTLSPSPTLTPTPTPASNNQNQNPVSNRVPVFPVNALRSDVEARLRQPTADRRGRWGNTRAVVYESVQNNVDLGFLFDRDSGLIRQTEISFRQSVELPLILTALDDMLSGQATEEIKRGLEQVQQRQIDSFQFTKGSLKGQIVRQDCDDIYISIWDEQLHDFVNVSEAKRC